MKYRAHGFTIVELLIVIVVIAILAALSYVGYVNISNRAYDSSVQSDLQNMGKKVRLFRAEYGNFPSGSGNTITSPEPVGIGVFQPARQSYDTSVYNLYYCWGTVDGVETFAIGARSRSGNRFFIAESGGVVQYTGAAVFNGGGNTCPAILPGNTGYSYSSAGYNPTLGWAAWTE